MKFTPFDYDKTNEGNKYAEVIPILLNVFTISFYALIDNDLHTLKIFSAR